MISFDYSEKQWARIGACLRSLGRYEFVPLEVERLDRLVLVDAANRYLDRVKLEREPAKRIEDLNSIQRMANELCTRIKNIDPRERFVLSQSEIHLRDLENRARYRLRSVERQLSRITLYRSVFNLWTVCGGDLVCEQHDGEPHGPLIKFVQAVIAPILRMPLKAGTIRTRIEAEKKIRSTEDALLEARVDPDRRELEMKILGAAFYRESSLAEEIAAITLELQVGFVGFAAGRPASDDPALNRYEEHAANELAKRIEPRIRALIGKVVVVRQP